MLTDDTIPWFHFHFLPVAPDFSERKNVNNIVVPQTGHFTHTWTNQPIDLKRQVSVLIISHHNSRKETGQDTLKTPNVLNQDKYNLESYSEGTLKIIWSEIPDPGHHWGSSYASVPSFSEISFVGWLGIPGHKTLSS